MISQSITYLEIVKACKLLASQCRTLDNYSNLHKLADGIATNEGLDKYTLWDAITFEPKN